jgi:hypothetical protein
MRTTGRSGGQPFYLLGPQQEFSTRDRCFSLLQRMNHFGAREDKTTETHRRASLAGGERYAAHGHQDVADPAEFPDYGANTKQRNSRCLGKATF